MAGALGIGFFASGFVAAAVYLQSYLGAVDPLALLAIAAVAALFQKYTIDRFPTHRTYEGLPDLFAQIHSPSLTDLPWRWALRGFLSFLFAAFGGLVGPEGAAVELCYAVAIQSRSRTARWFENRRRTDTALSLAAGVSAAFGAPFAGFLFSVEMSIGGRALHSAVASIAAFVGMRYFAGIIPFQHFELAGGFGDFGLGDWRKWLSLLVISVTVAAVAALLVRFFQYCRDSLFHLYRARGWMRILAGGVLLYLIAILYRRGFAPPSRLLEDVLWLRVSTEEAGLILFSQVLAVSVLLSTFGTIGVLWPLFSIGGILGFIVNHWLTQGLTQGSFATASGLIGASALWGAVLGTPVSAAVLCFEITHNLQLLFPCLVAGLIAQSGMKVFKGRKLVDMGLEARGLRIIEGRSISVLDSISVRDAMVTDCEVIREHEAVSELQDRLGRSRYPFLPVVRAGGEFVGLLTLDMVQEAWHTDKTVTAPSSLSKLLEVKDLLYRTGFKVPPVRGDQKLSDIFSLLQTYPCLPVIGEEEKVLGLLFVQNVRQAYDREVVRRSLELAAL